MLLLFIFGFFIPWILVFIIYRNYIKTILLIAPISSVIAYTIDILGSALFEYWRIEPFSYIEPLAAMPLHLGLYPITGSVMIICKPKFNNDLITVLLFSLIITLIESTLVFFDYLHYYRNWNMLYTFFSYLFSLLIVYFYFKALIKVGIKID